MALVYATEADVTEQLAPESTPDNVARLLTVASRWVRHATRTAVYDTTAAGLPSDEDVAAAFRDATVEQVLAWIRTGVQPDEGVSGAIGKVVTQKTMRSVTLQYAGSSEQVAERAKVATVLADEARMILADAGLLGGPVTVWG